MNTLRHVCAAARQSLRHVSGYVDAFASHEATSS
jgi:hypothetical protein